MASAPRCARAAHGCGRTEQAEAGAQVADDAGGDGAAVQADADLDRQIVLGLNDMAAEWPSFGAMVSGLRESPTPADKELAGQIEAFIADWQAQQRQKVVQ